MPPRQRPRSPQAGPHRGRQGEHLAAAYLEQQGYEILARNWRAPQVRNELDLVARDGQTIVFVEVKSARTSRFGDPLAWVTPRKQAAIIRAAQAYVLGHDLSDCELRFDVVAVGPPRAGERPLTHLVGAFTADSDP